MQTGMSEEEAYLTIQRHARQNQKSIKETSLEILDE
jgi:AmiR/NasT family two-component response regulator